MVVLGADSEEVAARASARRRGRDPGPAGRHRRRGAERARRARGASDVIVLSGDHPLLDAGLITALAERHSRAGAAATVTTRELDDPGQYGRIVRAPDGDIERIVETKSPGDATPEELAIKEINAGTYAFAVEPLFEALDAGRHRQRPGRDLPRRRAAAAARRGSQRGRAT